jgi:hypothetical protein
MRLKILDSASSKQAIVNPWITLNDAFCAAMQEVSEIPLQNWGSAVGFRDPGHSAG